MLLYKKVYDIVIKIKDVLRLCVFSNILLFIACLLIPIEVRLLIFLYEKVIKLKFYFTNN